MCMELCLKVLKERMRVIKELKKLFVIAAK